MEAIEFMGGVTSRSKIGGFRIELGEIESVPETHPDAGKPVPSRPTRSMGSEKRLKAFVTPARTALLCPHARLRAWLGQKSPNYMQPSRFAGHAGLAVDAQRKVDRTRWRICGAGTWPLAPTTSRPGRTLERIPVEIWQEVLGAPQVGIH